MTGMGALIEVRDSLLRESVDFQPARPDAPAPSEEVYARKTPKRGSSDDGDEQYTAWLAAARATAARSRHLAEMVGNTPSALARLAHAEFAAGMNAEAEASAMQALLSISSRTGSQDRIADAPACFAAAEILAYLGKREVLESLLDELPTIPQLRMIRASLAVDAKDFHAALEILGDAEGAGTQSLRGYIYLMLNEHERAIRNLRLALRASPNDVSAAMNMAIAYRRIGAFKKSLKMSFRASRIAPGRKDASLILINDLASFGDPKVAAAEIRRVKESGVVETAGLLATEARVQAILGKIDKALAFLDRAVHLAIKEGDYKSAAEFSGSLAVGRFSAGKISRSDAISEVKKAIRRAPESVALATLLADCSNGVQIAPLIRQKATELRKTVAPNEMLILDVRLAYLESRFEDAAKLALKWSQTQQGDADAASFAVFLQGYATGDWKAAAGIARNFLSLGVNSRQIYNNAAFSMILSGQAEEGHRLLSRVADTSFMMSATRGLALIGIGDLEGGMREYRRAYSLLDKHPEGEYFQSLMTMNQGIGLRALGVWDSIDPIKLRAISLPGSLPSDWRNSPAFLALEHCCRVSGYPWPPTFD